MSRNAPACHINTDLKGASAGSFHWTTLYGVNDPGPFGIIFNCPCGCGEIHSASFDSCPPDMKGVGPRWHWDGDREKPTLTPSLVLNPKDGGYHWHGFLKAGVFEEC